MEKQHAVNLGWGAACSASRIDCGLWREEFRLRHQVRACGSWEGVELRGITGGATRRCVERTHCHRPIPSHQPISVGTPNSNVLVACHGDLQLPLCGRLQGRVTKCSIVASSSTWALSQGSHTVHAYKPLAMVIDKKQRSIICKSMAFWGSTQTSKLARGVCSSKRQGTSYAVSVGCCRGGWEKVSPVFWIPG